MNAISEEGLLTQLYPHLSVSRATQYSARLQYQQFTKLLQIDR